MGLFKQMAGLSKTYRALLETPLIWSSTLINTKNLTYIGPTLIFHGLCAKLQI